MSKMTLEELRQFRADAQKRGEENARKWHTSAEVQRRTRNASQAAVSKIRDTGKDD